MKQKETNRFNELYQRHLRLLKLQGKSKKTIDAYSRAVRRISEHFDCCPDQLTLEQRENYFSELVDSHSWSTVKVDRNGLQFFWKHVLKRDWQWIKIIKAPEVRSLPDILTVADVEQLIGATRKLRYRVFLLATYSMGLRLSETLALQVGDIDGQRKQIHIRRGKGHNSSPRKWVVDCTHVGKGLPALKYLSRYLYRGVIGENNIVANQDGNVTFKYVQSLTGKTRYRTVKGEDFLWLVLQHVLPKNFRRVRDYGFLHGNAKKLLSLVQMVLHVLINACAPRPRPVFKCPKCQAPMKIIAFKRPAWASG